MKDIITKIINKMTIVYDKIRRVDAYWSENVPLTNNTTISNVLTGFTVTVETSTVGVGLRGNTLIIGLNVTRTGSAYSTGKYIANKLCDITITGIRDYIPPNTVGYRTESVLISTAPMVNCTLLAGDRVNDDTLTKSVYLGQIVGGTFPQNTTYLLRVYCQIPRLVP